MLVLSRKLGEHVIIGTDIFLTIVQIRGDRVKIAIEAPRGIAVHREEVYQRI